jgi:DNA-binding response OmpR family regulator
VDGWLAALAATELGIERTPVLDTEARELVVNGTRMALTPLEFGVMKYLSDREGQAVSRTDLLRTVWDTSYFGGSNVVDTVVRSLRRKLGPYAKQLEAVTGVGYRLRSHS